jgi:hypothetical protein
MTTICGEEVSVWLIVISFIIECIFIFDEMFTKEIVFLVCIFAYICATLCATWASKINKCPNEAFCIGFFFGLTGTIGYYLYYRLSKARTQIVS